MISEQSSGVCLQGRGLWAWLALVVLSISIAVPSHGFVMSWGSLQPQFPAEPAPEAELSGRLLDAEGHPFSKVRVICFCEWENKMGGGGLWVKNLEPSTTLPANTANYRKAESTVTDEEGGFTFRVQRTQSWLLVLGKDGSALVHVGPAKSGGLWRLTLRPHASIEGTFRISGKPAARQGLILTQYCGLGVAGLKIYYTTQTDESGRYHVDAVASPHPWRPVNLKVECVTPVADLEKAMPGSDFGSLEIGGLPKATSIDTVVLHAGEKFSLALHGKADAEGNLIRQDVSPNEEKPSSGSVWLHVAGDKMGTPGLFLLTDGMYTGGWPPNQGWVEMGKGNWESRKFPAGEWSIQAGRMVDGYLCFSDVIKAKVEDGKTTGVVCELKRGAGLKGRLSDNVPRPVRNGHVLVWVEPAMADHPHPTRRVQWEDWTPVNEDGTFLFEALPPGDAEYIVTCDGWISESPVVRHPMQWAHGGPPLTVAARSARITRTDSQVLVPMVREGACRITVVDQEGKPAPGIRVTFAPQILHHAMWNNIHGLDSTPRALASLVPAGPRDNSYHTEKVWPKTEATTDANGVALVEHLPPVEEAIFAMAGPEFVQHIGGSYLTIGEALPDAQVVSIKPGRTTEVTVSVPAKERE